MPTQMPAPSGKTVALQVNGETREVPEQMTVLGLLEWLRVEPQQVAVEVDRVLVRQAEWSVRRLDPGAQVEVVQFVGGG